MTDDIAANVAVKALSRYEETKTRLVEYLTVPAISCDPDHEKDVAALCERVAEDLVSLGLENVIVRKLDDALPLVVARHCHAGDDKPTLLIYGHLDLQPVVGEPWSTPPHEGVEKNGRLYARGSADDMGGWVSHMAAIQAWLSVAGSLPLNIKLVLEGEEEIGSPNLERYMDEFPEDYEADVMVLTDCENPSTTIPGLTVSLRGLYEVEVVCEALESDVHSGLWGNAAPDAGNSLIKLLSRIIDEDGRLSVGRVDVPEDWRESAKQVPLDAETVCLGAKIIDGVDALPTRGRTYAEWAWRQPAVTVLSTTFTPPGQEKNALRQQASAILSIRVAPGQTADDIRSALEETLLQNPPGGVKVSLRERPASAESWLYQPRGEAFAAADRAYEKAWGHKLVQVGVGGSIPFVALFGKRFSQLPLILNGVMDPQTGAHGPNESMDLDVFKKAIVANVHLYQELATVSEVG